MPTSRSSNLGLVPVEKMATGAGWQPPPYGSSAGSSKYNTSPTSSMFYDGSVTLEYTQDLHLKMSKKIAQLTKVCSCEGMNEWVNDVAFCSCPGLQERPADVLWWFIYSLIARRKGWRWCHYICLHSGRVYFPRCCSYSLKNVRKTSLKCSHYSVYDSTVSTWIVPVKGGVRVSRRTWSMNAPSEPVRMVAPSVRAALM